MRRLMEEGTKEGTVVRKGRFASTLHVRAPCEGGCRVFSDPACAARKQGDKEAEDKSVMLFCQGPVRVILE